MTAPAGMYVGNTISASDVRNIYESLTSGGISLILDVVNVKDFYIKSTAISWQFVSKDSITSSMSSIQSFNDIDNVFNTYGLNASSAYEGVIKTVSWKEKFGNYQRGTACCLKSGLTSYKWCEMYKGNL